MKRQLIGQAVGVMAFIIGLFAAVPSIEGIGPTAVIDLEIYTCPILTDTVEITGFDSRVMRFKGEFFPMGNVNLGIIGDGPGWIRVICDDEAASCAKLFREPVRGCYKSIDVDVIGYYSERAVDPHPLQRGEKVRLFRVTDVIQAESVREEARIDDSDGCD